MCGITGIYAFNQVGRMNMINLAKATETLSNRGPDHQGLFNNEFVGLGHRRLSVLDTSESANQPMKDSSGRYTIIYNGEVYNFKELKQDLVGKGVNFYSESDTEVVLQMFIQYGRSCLDKFNGFFAFAVYDEKEHSLFLARDRYGIKPLYYLHDRDKVLFASELKSILQYGVNKTLNHNALYVYFHLTYIPSPWSIIEGVKKLPPGHYMVVKGEEVSIKDYYSLPSHETSFWGGYDKAKNQLVELVEGAVTNRLVSDVPLGTFLSGGIDSSIVSAVAARHVDHLNTFSIGYKDEPFFDETPYANAVARHIGSEHTVFSLSNNDLYSHVFDLLDYTDEPFGDSSSIAVNILSQQTKKHVTVVLSGDGADELFAGYNKHAAMERILHQTIRSKIAGSLGPLWKFMPSSRNGPISNKFRQLKKFSEVSSLHPKDQYWRLASWQASSLVDELLLPVLSEVDEEAYFGLKQSYTSVVDDAKTSITQMLLADMNLVLPNDMLTKVDRYSMINSLEVRVPFLDHRVVECAFSLPDEYKINKSMRKCILKDSFRDWLPAELYQRSKKGFEVPLNKWFRGEMQSMICHDLLNDDFVRSQGIFNPGVIKKLRNGLTGRFSTVRNTSLIWSLVVFQWWWKKYFAN